MDMSSELVLVETSTWPSTICTSLSCMRQANQLCDVTLMASDNTSLPAHSCMLAAASPYLRSLLTDAAQSCTLQLEVVGGFALNALVEFIYVGQVTVPLAELTGLSHAADQLGVEQLKELCDALFKQMPESFPNNQMDGQTDCPLPVDNLEPIAVSSEITDTTSVIVKTEADHSAFVEATATDLPLAQREVITEEELVMTEISESVVNCDTSQLTDNGIVHEDNDNVIFFQQNNSGETTLLHKQHTSEVMDNMTIMQEEQQQQLDNQTEQLLISDNTEIVQLKVDSKGDAVLLGVATPARPFACKQCTKTFARRNQLAEHERSHSGEVYSCNICSKTFQWRRGLELHARTHSGEKPYECDICGHRFSHASNLMVHKRRHSNFKAFCCLVCPQKFTSQSSLIRHRKRHMGVRAFACSYCDSQFFERNVLKRHMRKHTGEKPYSCNECDSTFADVTGLAYHRWTHRKDRPLSCNICGFGCISTSQLGTHMRTHTGERPFPCEQCGKAFKIRANLTAHKRTHTGERPYACCLCSSRFATSSQLSKHTLVHEKRDKAKAAEDDCPAELAPYQCSVCGKRFGRRNNMLQHERLHTGVRPFHCSGCYIGFYRRASLQKHQEKEGHGHPDDLLLARERDEANAAVQAILPCELCDKRFPDENMLLQHSIICSQTFATKPEPTDRPNELKITCDVCSRSFKRKTHLKQHMKTHDRLAQFFTPDGRPFECDICKKRFKRKSTLNQHRLTHLDTNSRRHLLCYICGRAFIRSTHLAAHLRKMHEQNDAADSLMAAIKIKSELLE